MSRENVKQVLSVVFFAIFIVIGAFIFVDKQRKLNRANEFMAQYRSENVESDTNIDETNDDSVEELETLNNASNVDVEKKKIIEKLRSNNEVNIVNPAKGKTNSIIEKNLNEETFYEKILSLKKEDETKWENRRYNQMLTEFANDIKENHNCNKFYWNYKNYIYYLLDGTRFLGDSNIYHLIRFNILPEKYTRQMRGQSITQQYDSVVEKVEGTEKHYVFWNGYNIKYFNDAEEYANGYEGMIKKLKAINENCDIYICSLLPATEKIVENDLKSDFVHNIYRGPEYDEGLQKHFGDNYIDTKIFLFSESQYQDDGVHLNMEYAKMLVSYVAFYLNRDKVAIAEKNHDELLKAKEKQDKILLEKKENVYYENNLINEATIDYKKRYAYKNLELFYQYKEFLKYINTGKGKNYYLPNKDYVKKLFKDVCVMGDSQVLRLERLKYLDRDQTVSFGGVKLNDLAKKIDEGKEVNIKKFKTIILWNGYNLKYVNDAKEYIDEYRNLIASIRRQNKNCEIYVCSLLPAEEKKIAEDIANGSLHNLDKGKEYDEALIEEFKENYINTKPFVHKNYDEDGTHMLESFYREAIPYIGFYINFMKLKNEAFVPETHITEEDIIKSEDKELYITFDDGPNKSTKKLLDVLRLNGVKATFFVTNQEPKFLNNLKIMKEDGHTIAVHTYSHDYSIYSSEETFFEDLFKMECEMYKEVGELSNIIRFPGGAGNISSKDYNEGIMGRLTQLVEDMGYVYYDWNVSSGDGGYISSAEILKNAKDGIGVPKEKHIVLFHDANDETVEIIDDFIQYAKDRGFKMLPLKNNSFICHFNVKN